MEAGFGRDTLVLASVAICLTVLVGCVEATRLSKDLEFYPAPSLGDRVVLRAEPTVPGVSFKARLPTGGTCSLHPGGELLVVTRDSSGEVGAIWSQNGPHHAADCGNGALVTLDGATFANLVLSAHGVDAQAALNYPAEL
jgi:hypothetical protein